MSLNSNQETIHLDHQQVMDLLLPVENPTATEDVYPIHCIFQKKLSKTYVSPKRTYEKNKQNQKNVQKNQNTSLQDVSNVEKNDLDTTQNSNETEKIDSRTGLPMVPVAKTLHELAMAATLDKMYLDSKKRKELQYLPRLNRKNLLTTFQLYDSGFDHSLDSKSLLKWMLDLRQEAKEKELWLTMHGEVQEDNEASNQASNEASEGDAEKKEKVKTMNSKLDETITKRIIGAHDDSGDGLLTWKEFVSWILEGSRFNQLDRNMLKERNDLFHYTVEFMEYVIIQSSINKKEDTKNTNGDKMEEMDVVEEMKNDQWLPPICKSNLLILFQR